MSEQPTSPAPATDKPRPRMKFTSKLLLIVFILLCMAFLRTGFLFVLIGMLPSIVIYYLDQSEARYRFKTIFYCNISGIMPFVARLLRYGPTSTELQNIMGSASTWAIIYGAAMMGGILISVTPLLAKALIGQFHGTHIALLQRTQRKIEGEWGKEVVQYSHNNDG